MSSNRALFSTLIVTSIAGLGLALGGLTSGQAAPPAQVSAPNDRCHQPGPYQLPHGNEAVELDPDKMSHRITHDFWPMKPGTRWTYSEGADVRVRVTVLERTRMVRGIRARVVHDVVRENGEIIENTFDWYAQDAGGSVWYLGEFSREYENGQPVNTAGSWEYGVDGAQAGVLLPAEAKPGCRYRQEYYAGEAEDHAAILSLREDLRLKGETFSDVLTTGDYVRLEPGVVEHKFYARGIGPVLAVSISPTGGREVLLSTNAD